MLGRRSNFRLLYSVWEIIDNCLCSLRVGNGGIKDQRTLCRPLVRGVVFEEIK